MNNETKPYWCKSVENKDGRTVLYIDNSFGKFVNIRKIITFMKNQKEECVAVLLEDKVK